MLYLISIGLSSEKDMSINALEAARKCDKLYAEFYTSAIDTDTHKLSELIGKNVEEINREFIENDSEKIIEEAGKINVGILVGGDCMTATTHVSLLIDAKKSGIETRVMHGSSVYTAVAKTGLQIYKFGRATTLPRNIAKSVYEVIESNMNAGLHTLLLLDTGMKISEAIEILEKMENEYRKGVFSPGKKIVACCRLGSDDETIIYGKMKSLAANGSMDKVQCCILIPGALHFKEEEALELLEA